METKKLVLTAILILIGLSVYSQSKNIDIVKEYYPHIYISIKNEAEKDKLKNKAALTSQMEQQSTAFLQIAESKILIDPDAMTDALLLESLNGEREYNRSVIDDLDIKNPYPLLRCNWYGVKTHYDKIKNSKAPYTTPLTTNTKTTESVNTDKYQDEIYGNERKYSTGNKNVSTPVTPPKDKDETNWGISANIGLSSITNLKNWDRNAKSGKALGVRFWGRNYHGSMFFIMAEVSFDFIHHSIYDSYTNKEGNLNQSYMNTRLIYGIYRDLSPSTTLLFGFGGFAGVNFSTKHTGEGIDDYEIFPSNNALTEFNYGLSGLLGIRWNRYEFALRPDWGLADISRDGLGFKSRTISLSVGYLF